MEFWLLRMKSPCWVSLVHHPPILHILTNEQAAGCKQLERASSHSPSEAHSLPVGQQSYEWVGKELDGGFGGKQQPNLHIFVQEVFVFAWTVRRDSGCVGHHVLCGNGLV